MFQSVFLFLVVGVATVDARSNDGCTQFRGLCTKKCSGLGYKYANYYCSPFWKCDCTNTVGCFSGEATLETPEGLKNATDVRLGDRILVRLADGTDAYREVYAFSSRRPDDHATFVNLTTVSFSVLASPDHMVLSGGRLRAARTLTPGDALHTWRGATEPVVSTELVVARGVFNVHARGSTGAFVNGILVSELTEQSSFLARLPGSVRESLIGMFAVPVARLMHGQDADTF